MAWFTKETDIFLKTPEDPFVYQNPLSTPSKVNSFKMNSLLPVGYIIKGNTCYTNVILHTLSILTSLSNTVPSESPSYLHFLNQLL